MSAYLDTSALVAMFVRETDSEPLLNWFNGKHETLPIISDWNITEFSAAINFKLNLGTINPQDRFDILNDFQNAKGVSLMVISVTSADFHRAATFANQADLRLRGGDALHLSIAAGRSLSILTLDKRMVAAANTLGIGIVPFD